MKQFRLLSFVLSLLGLTYGSCEFEQIDYRQPVPIAMEATDITSSSFQASWNAVEGEGSYTVLVTTGSTFDENNFVDGYPKTTNKTQFLVTDLEANQTYYYRVKVSSNDPTVEYSNAIIVETLPLLAPDVVDPKDVTPLSFKAQWRSVPQADGYRLYVSTNANFSDHLSDYNGKLVNDTTALVENLITNEDYFYRVKTVRGNSESIVSDLIRVSTSRLTKPVLKEVSEINFTSVTVNWEVVEGASSYLIFVSADQFVMTDLLPEYDGREVANTTSLAILGLNANTTYYYRVQAKNDQSESEKSDIGEGSTISLVAPTALSASAVKIDGFQANWDSVANASSYVLDISRNENFTDLLTGYNAKEIINTHEVVTGLSKNTTYYYRIRSKGFGAVSQDSDVITVRTTFFASPKALEADELQSTSFRAVWRPVNAADSYHIEVATDANFDNILSDYNNLKTTDTTQVVTGLIVNKRYFYRIRALKGSIFSGYSNIVDLTTTQLSEPQLSATTEVLLSSFTINWQPVTGATQYRVDVGFDPLVENKIATDYDNRVVNTTSLNVSGLDANRTYYFKVRAENDVSTGGSATGSAKTAAINPPTTASPTDVQLTSFQANWNIAANADSYLLDVALDPGFQNKVVGFNNRELTGIFDIVMGLQPNTTYYYRVRAKGVGSTSDYSNVRDAVTLPLSSPTMLNTTNQETYQFTANWDAVDGADSYLLYVATDEFFSPGTILSGYDGKEVSESSVDIVNIDPHSTYYYRVQSQKTSSVSSFSATTTVGACITNTCRLAARTYDDWREESYEYDTDGTVKKITLTDIVGGANTTIQESHITYNTNQRIASVVVDSISGGDHQWKFAYETYNVDQQRIKNIVIEQLPLTTTIDKFSFTYDGAGILTKFLHQRGEVTAMPIDTTFTLVAEENYSYSTNKISVTDSNDDLVKEVTLETNTNRDYPLDTKYFFNTESLLSSDLALLLFNPTSPAQRLLPFISDKSFSYYQFRENAMSSWHNFYYPYDYNEKMVAEKIRATNLPELTYQFSNCNF